MTRLILVTLLICSAAIASAEIAYVTDILRVGLHEAEDTSDQPFRSLLSGAELEVLERGRDYALVQTADGEQGWVKSAYLVADKPARLRVSKVEATLDIMRDELSRAQNVESQTEELGRNIQARENTSETDTYEARMDAYRGSLPLSWVVAALVVALAAGFFAGMWCLDTLIRRRHGGFRVY